MALVWTVYSLCLLVLAHARGESNDTADNVTVECRNNKDCSAQLACQDWKCVDPCEGVCGTNTLCRVVNHHVACACQLGFTGNPFEGCTSTTVDSNKRNAGKKKFHMDGKRATWSEALELCRSMNMTLATIENKEEHEQLTALRKDIINGINSDAGMVWTAGHARENNDNIFFWHTTGKDLSYFDWDNGEPSVFNNYRCLALEPKFWVGDCHAPYVFACEYYS